MIDKLTGTGGMGTSMTWSTFAPQGWACPKCGRVYSPTTMMCLYCDPKTTISTSTSTEVKMGGQTFTIKDPDPKDDHRRILALEQETETLFNRLDVLEERLDALTKQVSELTQAVGRLEGTHIKIGVQGDETD